MSTSTVSSDASQPGAALVGLRLSESMDTSNMSPIPETDRELLLVIHLQVETMSREFREWRQSADRRLEQGETRLTTIEQAVYTHSRDLAELRGLMTNYRLAADEAVNRADKVKGEFAAFLETRNRQRAVTDDRLKLGNRLLLTLWGLVSSVGVALLIWWITK